MRYKVLKEMDVETPEGIMTLTPEQVINLSKEEAIPLIEDGTITPIERVAYRVYSEILQAYLWVADTDEDMHTLRGQGVTEVIYSKDEIRKLRKLSKKDLKAIHEVKIAFPESSIENIEKKENR